MAGIYKSSTISGGYTSGGYASSTRVIGTPSTSIRTAPTTTYSGTPATTTYRSGATYPSATYAAPTSATYSSGATVGTTYSRAAVPTTRTVVGGRVPSSYSYSSPAYVGSGSVVRSGYIGSAPTYSSTTYAGALQAGPTYTQAAYETKHQDDPQLQNLKELRKTSGLKSVPVGDGLKFLKANSTDNKLTREEFLAAYQDLLKNHGVEVPPDAVRQAVFDLFDRDDNGVVDMMELICGISLLCNGSEDEKIHAVFDVFDENGDGFISMDEMFKFLTSVFKVVLTPNVMAVMNTMGVTVESPEDLASVTALECFKSADLNHDGKLSVTEFKSWFYAPKNDPSFLFSPMRKLLA